MALEPDITTDDLLNGRVRLRQPARGYRAGMDAALLAAACDAKAGDRVIEARAGLWSSPPCVAVTRPSPASSAIRPPPAWRARTPRSMVSTSA